MITKNALLTQYYKLVGQADSMLKLSLSKIRDGYIDHPICLIEYVENGIHEKSIEIRFDESEATLTCSFDNNGSCDLIFLYPDNELVLEKIVDYLSENYDYNFMRSRFLLPNGFVKVQEVKNTAYNLCLVFYQ